jgi:hypothetical protein
MHSQIKIGGHAIQSGTLLKGLGLGLAISAGILGWMWNKKHHAGMHTRNNMFTKRGRKWPEAVPVK